jgi:hypothetical protein
VKGDIVKRRIEGNRRGMKASLALALLGFCLTGAGPARASGEVPIAAFGVGEVLTYAVKWGPVRAGTAVMAVKEIVVLDGRPCYHIVSEVRSNGVFTLFYPVEDRVETWIDVERLVPLKHEKHLREGTYVQDETVVFDHAVGRARYADGEWADFEPGVQDILSALYYVRSLKLPQEGSIFIENQTNKKNFRIEVRVLREEELTTPVGGYDCSVIEPFLKTTGLFKQEGRLWIWLAEGAARLPVQMKSKIKVGSITAILESVRPGLPAGELRDAGGGEER